MNVFSFRRLSFGLALLLAFLAVTPFAHAVSPNLVISQVYGGGGNSGATLKNDFIELFNRGTTTVSVATWSVQYASSAGSSWARTNLTGSIAPGQYYLVQQAQGAGGTVNLPTPDATGTTAMSATSGKVALVANQTNLTCGAVAGNCFPNAAIVDFVGYGAAATNFEGAPTATLSNTTAALRATGGCTDSDNNASDFATGSPNPRNTASALNVCSGPGAPTNPTGVGAANPNIVEPGEMTTLTVTVTPGSDPTSTGITVTGNLSSIGGSTTQMFFDDATNGDTAAGDNVFSYQVTVLFSTTPGNKSIPVTVADAQARSSMTSIALAVVTAKLEIHDIQGAGSSSPYAGQFVGTTGIVTARRFNNGFFIQDPTPDADPSTSEGIFIFTSSAPPAAAAVGNSVSVAGTVVEFIPGADPHSPPLTEIGGSPTVSVHSTGNPLPAPIPLTAADTSPAGSIEQLEKYEGMRVSVDSLTVSSPTMGSISEANATSTSNGTFYGVITGISRPFREPGIETPDPFPAGSPCCIPIFDANPERIRVDSDGQIGASALEVTTGATVTGLVGPLDYGFRTYTILPDPATPPGASGNVSATAVPIPAADEVTVGSFNLERFFDTANDAGVSDVALTATAFANRLNKASLAIRNVMRAPHIIGVQEVENLTTLQALANKLNADDPSLSYVAYLEEGNDIGGIDVGFLVNSNRISVTSVTQVGKTATFIDPTDSSVDLLNDRPPLVLEGRLRNSPGSPFRITVIVNHLRSLNDVDDPVAGARVRAKRGFQAEFLANYIAGRHTKDRIISVGDYNAFQFNDGYVDSIGTIIGRPTAPDEVVFASEDLVNPNLRDLVELVPADQQYSYTFDGNAQVLDHILITPNLLERFRSMNYGRNGADFPESYRNDATRPERVSDHDMPVAYFQYGE
ncbi:MAG: lamin tail domain-containing protein [Acidobacteriota bacterium]|nr:lamin tail domain-containing protein [Acidobacteriota bacterium]